MRFRALPAVALVSALLAHAAVLATSTPVAAVAGTTLYVDGKNGNDGNSGLSWGSALRTINRAARDVPHGSAAAGWTVVVRGYSDYIYRERPVPGGYDRWGTASAPVVFMAEGWSPAATDYVKPIVSGAQPAPAAGESWHADTTAGVWYTAWNTEPVGFDPKKPYSSVVFQDETRRLWQHPSLSDLRASAADGKGGYWYDAGAGRLYVATRKSVSPGSVSIEVPVTKGFYFDGGAGADHISVRGFEVRHSEMGIAFYQGADHGSAFDNVAIGNTPMGFATSGRITKNGWEPSVGTVFERNKVSYSTLQGFKIDAGSRGTTVCHNTARHNALQGIKVQGSDPGDPRVTSGIEVCFNVLAGQNSRRPGPGRADEEPNGLTIANGARDVAVHHNTIRRNIVGVMVNQNGAGTPVDDVRFRRNAVSRNSSVGLNLRDGVAAAKNGAGTLAASYNTYWANGIGIRVHEGSTNKNFDHETVYDNAGYGIVVGCGCSSLQAAATITDSLVTHNGSAGIRVPPGQNVTISWTGIGRNADGGVSGYATKQHLNTKAPAYDSQDPGSPDFLVIGPGSYQYTAGPSGTPIGART